MIEHETEMVYPPLAVDTDVAISRQLIATAGAANKLDGLHTLIPGIITWCADKSKRVG